MAPQPPSTKPPPPHRKLPRLPPNQKISKRPLLHAPIASPLSSSSTASKEIYISSNSPFIATIKRVKNYLSAIEKRAAGSIPLNAGHKGMKAAIEAGIDSARGRGKLGKGEEVILKATGRAIEKLLRVALYFQQDEGVKVELRTGSVGAVDDVVEKGGGEVGSRVRRASVLEVGVRLR